VTLPRTWKVPCASGSPAVPGRAALALDEDADVAPAVTVTVGDDDPHPARHPPATAVVPAIAAIRRQENVTFMPFSISYVESLNRAVEGVTPRSGRARINSVDTFLRYRTTVTGRLPGTWNPIADGPAG
jgi:hypothetical protein